MVHLKGHQAIVSQKKKKSFLALKTINQRGKKYPVVSARQKSLKNKQIWHTQGKPESRKHALCTYAVLSDCPEKSTDRIYLKAVRKAANNFP